MKLFIAFIFVFLSLSLFSQEFSNIVSYQKDKKIIVTYDLINTAPHTVYDIKLKFQDSTGKIIFPRTIYGDLGKVSRGKNKMIVWDVTRDQKEISTKLDPILEVTRSQYMMPKSKPESNNKSTRKSKNKNIASGELHGLFFGASTGLYLANKYTANYFNGTGVNRISVILDNPQMKEKIQEALSNQNYSYDTINSLPHNMKYDPALTMGFLARYYISNRSALSFEFNSVKLKTADKFTLNIDSVNMSFSDAQYVSCDITGNETRFDMNLCWYQVFGNNKTFNPYAEFGLNFNNTLIKKNDIKIRSLTYSIMNPSNAYYKIQNGGVGYGFLAGAGVSMKLNENFTFDIGFNVTMKKIGLVGYDDALKPNVVLYIRMILLTFGVSGNAETQQPSTDELNK